MPQTNVKLGKKPPRIDSRTLQFKDFLKKTAKPVPLPPPPPPTPATVDWLKSGISWGSMGNLTYGDCVEAAGGHAKMIWDSYTSPSTPPPTATEILALYTAITGFNPDNPNTDQGTDMLTFMKYWRTHGILGKKIDAFLALTANDLQELQQATWLAGTVLVGLAMPVSAQGQQEWTILEPVRKRHWPPQKRWGSWGGHCVPVGAFSTAYNETGIISWGEELLMAGNFYQRYNDEAWVPISKEWIESNGEAPNYLDLAAIETAVRALTS